MRSRWHFSSIVRDRRHFRPGDSVADVFPRRFLRPASTPEINHPELYYGFVGVTLAWQIVYVLIGLDPLRYRPFMLLARSAKGHSWYR